MPRSFIFLLALATLTAGTHAQSPAGNSPSAPDNSQSQPAPIVRSSPGAPASSGPIQPYAIQPTPPPRQVISSQPIPGVFLRVDPNTSVQTVSATATGTELRIVRGVANVSVRHPGQNAELLVDLPGGQVSLLKDGLYTFNTETNVVRVLKGEAEAYPGATAPAAGVKGVKVKENQQLVLTASGDKSNRAIDVESNQLMADYLPTDNGDGRPRPAYRNGYGYGPYGDGYTPYPYYAYGNPWYPYYGFGYPYGVGVGFGFYGRFGGFRGGGFRGGRL